MIDTKGFMKHARSLMQTPVRILTLVAMLMFSAAHADEYSDVSQLVRAGKFNEASAKAEQFLAAKPKDPQMRFLMGVIQRDSGKTSEAIITFTRLTEDYPELPEPYNNLAVLHASQSQFDKARISLEMAIRTNPSYATAHENLGDVYAKLASQAYNKALQLDTGNQAVPPKLALIRELFNPGAKGQRPTAAGTNFASASPNPGSTSTVATSKPPPSLPAVGMAKPASQPAPLVPPPPFAAATTTASKAATSAPSAASSTPAAATNAVASGASAAAAAASASAAVATARPQPSAPEFPVRDVDAAIKAWASAWSSKNVKAYLASYSKDFDTPGGQKRSEWEESRKQRILGKSKITVKVENLNIKVDGNKATASFRQEYKADGLSVGTRKTMELVKNGDRWLIVRESTGNR